MGKPGGFMEFGRAEPGYRPAEERVKDFRAVEKTLSTKQVLEQAARCMNCGIPFCHGAGCPLGNLIPEWNEAVFQGDWGHALKLLTATSSFPEFTARVCPAPCEASCVCEYSNAQPVTIRQIERAIIENGFEKGLVVPCPPKTRTGKKVAVIGSGPAGLTIADVLNKAGHKVTVYDEWPKPGGILRYGIPDFKLEKWVIDRRVKLMEDEGVEFENSVAVGKDLSYKFLKDRFDAVCLSGGAREPRTLDIPGRDTKGIYFAMDFLTIQNRKVDGEAIAAGNDICAEGKDVVVIGGGDTGSDCVGTSIRQKARSVTQIEIMPEPPAQRCSSTPWPQWPLKLRTSSSHQEGCTRLWGTTVTEFMGQKGILQSVNCVKVKRKVEKGGRISFSRTPQTEFKIPAQIVLLALGFIGPTYKLITENLGLEKDKRGNIKVNSDYSTNVRAVFAAGDMATGQSLVVHAMADGKKCAVEINSFLKSNGITT